MRRVRLVTGRPLYAASRHGAYSTGLLPGEDPAAFEKLHRSLVAEFSPDGPAEEDIVWEMTRILWRKNHMEIVRAAQRAWDRYSRIESRCHSEKAKEMRMSY